MIDSKLPAGCEEAARRPPTSGVATATSTRRPRCTDAELITLAIAQVFMGLPNDRQFLPLAGPRRQAAPRATQAFAETTNGGSGSLSLQSSRNAVRRSGSRPATCAPDGATPSVNGSH